MVVTAIGATPVIDYLGSTPPALYDGNIITNEVMQSSTENVYAAGDISAVKDMLTGELTKSCTWPDATKQGMLAGTNMAGEYKPYEGVTIVLSSHFFDVQFCKLWSNRFSSTRS